METKKPMTSQPKSENEKTPKLSLVSETKESPTDSQLVDQANGQPTPTPNEMLPSEQLELTKEDKKVLAKMRKQMERQGVKPAPGFTFNPLLKLGPNIPCPCLSEKKFKVCCRDQLAPFVTIEVAKSFEEQMAMPDLVFMTPHNKEKIAARIAPHVKENLKKQQQIADEKAAFEKRKIDDALSKSRR